jgi:hypothetical protein
MREFLNTKTVVIADVVEQAEIPFEPTEAAEPALNQSAFDSSQFKQAFSTALKEHE